MQPETTPTNESENAACLTCDGPLPPGRKLRCDACIQATEEAIREARGQVIKPSDIARVRER